MVKKCTLNKLLIIIYMLIACLLFVSHDYNDFLITTRQSINLWKNLFDGDLLSFQSINVCSSGNIYYSIEQGCAYNIVVYIVFAIWNIPLALLEHFTTVDIMNNIFTILWAKGISVFFFAVSIYLFWKIEKILDVEYDRSKLCVFLYSTSILALSYVFQVGGYDVLNVVMIMLAFKYYLEDKKVLYVLLFGFSFCFKFFTILIILPLYLIKEKRIYRILLLLTFTMSPYILTTVPFGGSAKDGVEFTMSVFNKMINSPFIYMFVFVYVISIVFAYIESDFDKNHLAIFVCFISFASFFTFLGGNSYWIILISPFLYLLLSKTKELKVGIILESCFGFFYVINSMINQYWVYFGETMRGMAIDRIFDRNFHVLNPLSKIVENLQFDKLLNPLVFSLLIVFIYLNMPKKENEKYVIAEETLGEVKSFRLILSLICLLPIITAINCW